MELTNQDMIAPALPGGAADIARGKRAHSFYADNLVLAGGDCLTRKILSLHRRPFTVYTGQRCNRKTKKKRPDTAQLSVSHDGDLDITRGVIVCGRPHLLFWSSVRRNEPAALSGILMRRRFSPMSDARH
jgi:hypothetical protein